MSQRNPRTRLFLQLWLAVSVTCFVWNAIPVLARYRADRQRLVELEGEQGFAPVPVIVLPDDSPWPTSTIQMQGRVVKEPRWNGPSNDSAFGQQRQLAVVNDNVAVVDFSSGNVMQSFQDKSGAERVYNAAVSGDGKVVATVGEFTRIQFWDTSTGRLIQSIEDKYPTLAAQPDQSKRDTKHPNGLRYSSTGVRIIEAAPGGCLFAIGKIDGSIELWAADDRELPDRPNGLTTADWPYRPDDTRPAPQTFRLLSRSQPHVGRITDLSFTLDCQALVTVSGPTFQGVAEIDSNSTMPPVAMVIEEMDSQPRIVRIAVPTGDTVWSVPLSDNPAGLALDSHSQNTDGLPLPAQCAVAMYDGNIWVLDLVNGQSLQSFSASINNRRSMIRAIAFADASRLWTTSTRYVNRPNQHSVGSVSAWDIRRGRRIATAEIPGQFFSADWDMFGMRLATSTYNSELASSRSGRSTGLLPWRRKPVSPFATHLWNVKLIERAPTVALEPTK